MKKQKERFNKKRQQKRQSHWLIFIVIALTLIATIWIVLSRKSSENNGINPIGRLNTNDFHSLAFSLTEPETVYFGHHQGLLVSHNGGKDWESTALGGVDAMALALPSSNPQIMYAAGHDVFFKSGDGGQTWESVSTDLPGSDIHGFAVNPEDASEVYAHVVGYGIFGSEDGGSTWELLSDIAPSSTFNLAVGKNSETLYAATGDAGLWQSLDGGRTWIAVKNIPDSGAIALTYVHANRRLYVTTLGDLAGLYVSDDNGQSWKSAGLSGTLLAVAVSPLDPNHIVVVNDQGEVFASRDGGLTWLDK